jgi:hypothetical protein|tara:strand:- start:827 stop:1000 length:174 start_codon:yes stop_codon:yes gene_type:complete
MKELIKKRRCMRHKKYVRQRMAELQSELCQEAITTGKVNLEKRQQLLKYKSHYEYFK